jgi:hypothetical protein
MAKFTSQTKILVIRPFLHKIKCACPRIFYCSVPAYLKSHKIQSYSKKKYALSKIYFTSTIEHMATCYIYILKGKPSKLLSHLTSTRCEPHVWRGRCQIDNPTLRTLHITPLGRQNYCARAWHLARDSNQNFEIFPFHPYREHGFSVISFCKVNFWKCMLLFE